MQNTTFIETVYTLEQAEKVLSRKKLSYRILATIRRGIKQNKAEIITNIKAMLIGIIIAIAFLLWLCSNGKLMDLCIYIGSFVSIIGVANL